MEDTLIAFDAHVHKEKDLLPTVGEASPDKLGFSPIASGQAERNRFYRGNNPHLPLNVFNP